MLKAKLTTKCPACRGGITIGDPIIPGARGFIHLACYRPKPSAQQVFPAMKMLDRLKKEGRL